MDESQVRGMSVVGIGEARRLGTIEHAYLDPQQRRIVAFGVRPRDDAAPPTTGALEPSDVPIVDVGPLLAYLPVAAVRAIGADAVTVDAAAALQTEEPTVDGAPLIAVDALEGLPVGTASGGNSDGDPIGRLGAVGFDPATFALTEIEVVHGLIRRRSRLPIALVNRFAADRIEVAAEAAQATGARSRRHSAPAEPPTRAAARTKTRATTAESTGAPPRNRSRKANRLPRSERRRTPPGGSPVGVEG